MSKIKPLLPGPVALARRVLDECDVRHPRDIRVEVMAARYDAMIVYGPVDTARGAIVRTSKRAVILVDEKAKGEPRAEFTGAHELGHHLMHDVDDHFEQCKGERAEGAEGAAETLPAKGSHAAREAKKRARLVEREANHFATELSMPERWAAPLCDALRPGIDDVYRLSRLFRASFHASAIRFVELTRAPCAFVHTRHGRVKRSTETETFPGAILQRSKVHPGTVAARLQERRPGAEEPPQEVPAEAWGGGARGFIEHAMALGPEIGVMSWVVAIG